MSDSSPRQHDHRARSFGEVAEAYDRARPSYPRDAVDWLVGGSPARVLELGAGTGKLTEVVLGAGHDVLAVDPLPAMLQQLARRTSAPHVVGRAEEIPVASRSVDVVLCGQAFHWFDHRLALREMARVLRPGGVLALVWNDYDVSIPWVRRLARVVDPEQHNGTATQPHEPLLGTAHFGFVEERSFRFWQPHTAASLADYACSTSYVATLGEPGRDELLARLRALYDDYGRGPDGMQLPWLTRCYRAVVRHQEEAPPVPTGPAAADLPTTPEDEGGEDTLPVAGAVRRPPEDPGLQLIDFR